MGRFWLLYCKKINTKGLPISIAALLRLLVFCLLAFNYIVFCSDAEPWLAATAKLLPILWLVLWAVTALGVRSLLPWALLLGGCGDVLLALNLFVPGLAAFLLGHLVYSLLWIRSGAAMRWWACVPTLLLMAAAFTLIIPNAGGMLLPVALYLFFIALMALLAARSRLVNGYGLLGVYSFLLSDFLLAWNLYRAPIEYSVLLVMTTYYLAQGFICLSVLQRVAAGCDQKNKNQ